MGTQFSWISTCEPDATCKSGITLRGMLDNRAAKKAQLHHERSTYFFRPEPLM